MGLSLVRVITPQDATDLVNYLRAAGYGVTILDAQGKQGPGKVIFSVIKRKDIRDVENAIHEFAPKAFYSVEDIRRAAKGTFPVVANPKPFHLDRGTGGGSEEARVGRISCRRHYPTLQGGVCERLSETKQ